MHLTYLGHSCMLVETSGSKILIDPLISGNPLAKHIDPATVEADLVLLTHGHGDHVLDAEAILKRTGATLFSNYEIVTWYGTKGMILAGTYSENPRLVNDRQWKDLQANPVPEKYPRTGGVYA